MISISLDFWTPTGVLLGAAVLDFLVGDPWNWPHPVQVMGCFITQYRQQVFQWTTQPQLQKILGIALTLLLSLGSGAIAWSLLWLVGQASPLLKFILEIILLASCFAGRSLRDAATDVLEPLSAGDLREARSRLSRYVGRDTQHLDEPEILRAVLETVSENGVDGVLAPLFYAILGLALSDIGPVPLAIAYKAVSTLDSMVGYRTALNTHLGWCSAKTDDILTWVPCRCAVLTLALLSRHPLQVWRQCQQDGPKDPSPNSGWSECAYASSLGVQLGGENIYQGKVKIKPYVGQPKRPISTEVILEALRLTRHCFMLWIIVAISVLAAFDYG